MKRILEITISVFIITFAAFAQMKSVGTIKLDGNAAHFYNGTGAFTAAVTSIATTSPISGGTITGTGTISCSTCLTTSTTFPYDLVFSLAGLPPSSTTLPWYAADRTVTLPANFSGAACADLANATSSTAFTVKKNGSTVGTITFGTGGTCTYSTSGGTTVTLSATGNAGNPDYLTFVTPAQDATLSDIMVTIPGTR